MKILHVCHHYYPSPGGVGVHVRNICERLAREHDVTIYTTYSFGTPPEIEDINGVHVRRFKVFNPNNSYYFSFKMLKCLRKSRFDIVHAHNYHAFPCFLARYAKRNKFVVTPHYHRHGITAFRDVLIKLYKPFGRRIFHDADKVITSSNHEKGLLIQDFKIPDDKISLIPNGVDLKTFRNLERKGSGQKTILYISTLEQFKGVQYAIQTLPLLDESVRLDIVGRGRYKYHLADMVRNMGLGNRVSFYHSLYGQDLLDKYANANLLMLLSEYESFGMVVAEALAAKIPCIVSNQSALKEWVDNDNCVGIDYPIDCKQLAGLINMQMGKVAGDVRIWDWDQVVDETLKIYRE